MFKTSVKIFLLMWSSPSGNYNHFWNLNHCYFPPCDFKWTPVFQVLVWRAGAPKYSDPDFKVDFTQRAIFFHDGESSWWIKISIAIVKSNSNDMGPSPWTQKPALKNVIFASHGVGNGNLCPLCCRRGWYKRRKIYSFAAGLLYDNQRRHRQNSVVPHNRIASKRAEVVNGDLYLRIIIFLAPCMKCVKTQELDYLIDELINYFFSFWDWKSSWKQNEDTRSVVLGKVFFFFFFYTPPLPKVQHKWNRARLS